MIWVSGESIIYEKALTIILLPSTAQSNGYCSDKLRDHQVGSFDLDDPFYCCHHLKRPSNILHAYESGAFTPPKLSSLYEEFAPCNS